MGSTEVTPSEKPSLISQNWTGCLSHGLLLFQGKNYCHQGTYYPEVKHLLLLLGKDPWAHILESGREQKLIRGGEGRQEATAQHPSQCLAKSKSLTLIY